MTILQQQPNNFNIIRLLAAVFVIFSHSFGFFHQLDPVKYCTNGQLPGGQLAVYIFFVLSGYLITASWLKKENVRVYLESRVRRIFPALVVTVFLSVFIFGPLLTSLSLESYFSSADTYAYFWNLSLWKMSMTLPGVFVYEGKEHTFNAPLWTLFFEFLMYLLVILFGLMKLFRREKMSVYLLWTFFISSLILCTLKISPDLFMLKIGVANFVRFFAFFFSGALYYLYLKGKKPQWFIPVLFLCLSLALRSTQFFFVPALFCIVTSVFYIGFHEKKFGTAIVSKGDFSYGTYLYGFIVQSIVFQYFGKSLNPMTHFLISTIFTLPLAILSWNLIEEKLLKRNKSLL
ncbi:MAG: acyltransferase family protein [Bacteroidota bacterium]